MIEVTIQIDENDYVNLLRHEAKGADKFGRINVAVIKLVAIDDQRVELNDIRDELDFQRELENA